MALTKRRRHAITKRRRHAITKRRRHAITERRGIIKKRRFTRKSGGVRDKGMAATLRLLGTSNKETHYTILTDFDETITDAHSQFNTKIGIPTLINTFFISFFVNSLNKIFGEDKIDIVIMTASLNKDINENREKILGIADQLFQGENKIVGIDSYDNKNNDKIRAEKKRNNIINYLTKKNIIELGTYTLNDGDKDNKLMFIDDSQTNIDEMKPNPIEGLTLIHAEKGLYMTNFIKIIDWLIENCKNEKDKLYALKMYLQLNMNIEFAKPTPEYKTKYIKTIETLYNKSSTRTQLEEELGPNPLTNIYYDDLSILDDNILHFLRQEYPAASSMRPPAAASMRPPAASMGPPAASMRPSAVLSPRASENFEFQISNNRDIQVLSRETAENFLRDDSYEPGSYIVRRSEKKDNNIILTVKKKKCIGNNDCFSHYNKDSYSEKENKFIEAGSTVKIKKTDMKDVEEVKKFEYEKEGVFGFF